MARDDELMAIKVIMVDWMVCILKKRFHEGSVVDWFYAIEWRLEEERWTG